MFHYMRLSWLCERGKKTGFRYFEDTYIGAAQRRRRRDPVYPIDLWNVHQRTLNNQQRTNDDVEGWHRGFQLTCGVDFPNIFRFINALKRQQALHNVEITQLIAGQPSNQKNKKYVKIADRVRNIVQQYANRNLVDYLRGIAYNFEFYHDPVAARAENNN